MVTPQGIDATGNIDWRAEYSSAGARAGLFERNATMNEIKPPLRFKSPHFGNDGARRLVEALGINFERATENPCRAMIAEAGIDLDVRGINRQCLEGLDLCN